MTGIEITTNREQYTEAMQKAYMFFSGPWTQKWIQKTKYMLEMRSKLMGKDILLYEKYIKDKYYLIGAEPHGQLIRVFKTLHSEICIPVVPWENAFDLVWNIHVNSGHSNVNKTVDAVRKHYFIDNACISYIVSACAECQRKEETRSLEIDTVQKCGFNQMATLEVLDMSAIPDGNNKYIIIYTDENTGLVQLRAITEYDKLQLALQLIKIFADLGLPGVLKVNDLNKHYLNAINIVNGVLKPSAVTLKVWRPSNSQLDVVKELILQWMIDEISEHWEIGCYVVQWNINNAVKLGKTPQQLVFGRSFKDTKNPWKDEGTVATTSINVDRKNSTDTQPMCINIYDNDIEIEKDPLEDDES